MSSSNYYAQHRAYSTLLGVTPTWGVPQEGDGSAITASPTASTAAINIGASGSTAGNTVSVCGITFTAAASRAAGSANFVASSNPVTAANNLVAALNDCTTTVNSSVAIGTPRISNLIYARGPAIRADSTPTVDIMMRVGSAALNRANNSSLAFNQSGAWITSFTDFANGVGGCWGLTINDTTIGVSGFYNPGDYGIFSNSTTFIPFVICTPANPTVQTLPAADDYIRIRPKSPVNSLVFPQGMNISLASASYHQNVVFDHQPWGDSGSDVFSMAFNCNGTDTNIGIGNNNMSRTISAVNPKTVKIMTAITGAGSNGNLRINLGNGNGGWPFLIDNIWFVEQVDTSGVNGPTITFNWGGVYSRGRVKDCTIDYLVPRTTARTTTFQGGLNGNIIIEGCDINYNYINPAEPSVGSVLLDLGAGLNGNSLVRISNVNVTGWAGGKIKPLAMNTDYFNGQIVIENCTGIRLDVYNGLTGPTFSGSNPNSFYTFISIPDSGNAFRLENGHGVIDWNPNAATPYPLLSALQEDGATRWSWKIDWLAATFTNLPSDPLTSMPMATLSRGPTATKNVSMEFMALSTSTMNSNNVSFRVTYTDNTGKVRTQRTRYNANAIQNSAAVWTNASNFPNHVARKVTVTTAYPVRQYTKVFVCVELYAAANLAEQIYIDPVPNISETS